MKRLLIVILLVATIFVLGSVVICVAGCYLKPSPTPEPKQIIHFDYDLPEGQQFTRSRFSGIAQGLAISPDGSEFVYSTPEGLFLRSMKERSARLLHGTEGRSTQPFFSPDGQWIGYWNLADNKLKKVAVSGGVPADICDVGPSALGASWSSDNTIVYSDATGGGILRVSADGGTPEVLLEADIAERSERGLPADPQILPDRKTLLFTNMRSMNNADNEIMIFSLESGARKELFKGGNSPKYLPIGHIAYTLTTNDSTDLLAIPFDLNSLEITGKAVSIVEGVDETNVDFSSTGTLVYIPDALAEDDSAQGKAHKINIVLNWFEELKDRVPVD